MRKFAGLITGLILVLCVVPLSWGVGSTITHNCDISWTAPTLDQNGNPLVETPTYKVYWGTSPGVYGTSVAISATSTTCSAVGITVNGQYYLTVSAVNSKGEGPQATEVPFVLSIPSGPTVVESLTDVQGTWILYSDNTVKLNGVLLLSDGADLRLCNGEVQIQILSGSWWTYNSSTQVWTQVSATCPLPQSAPQAPSNLLVQ